jgi:hypothetical protein
LGLHLAVNLQAAGTHLPGDKDVMASGTIQSSDPMVFLWQTAESKARLSGTVQRVVKIVKIASHRFLDV